MALKYLVLLMCVTYVCAWVDEMESKYGIKLMKKTHYSLSETISKYIKQHFYFILLLKIFRNVILILH